MTDYFNMADEDFDKELPPEIKEDDPEPKGSADTSNDNSNSVDNVNDDAGNDTAAPVEQEKDKPAKTEPVENSSGSNEGVKTPETVQATSEPEPDYKQFYTAITSPIKANGKEIQIKSPQDVIRLMQMGANYTHKMQSLAPYRKKMQMLENAGLFEEDKINFLIDLSQKKPEAISKFLRDNKIDPLDIDVSDTAPKYVPGNHQVSDAEMHVNSVVDDLKSTPDGIETLKTIGNWDQASLQAIYSEPDIMHTIHEQKQNGVFDLISNEIERQKVLGRISADTPFLQAYQIVGGALLQQYQASAQQQRVMQNLPKGTLPQQPKTNSAQVKSAAPTGRSNKSATQFIDPFTLSDEEFEKQFKNYV